MLARTIDNDLIMNSDITLQISIVFSDFFQFLMIWQIEVDDVLSASA